MMTELINQFFDKHMLQNKVSNFYDKYYELLQKYDLSKLKLIERMFIHNI